jgi:hypothetical protein
MQRVGNRRSNKHEPGVARPFARLLPVAAALSALALAAENPVESGRVTFELLPAAQSGIHWAHENAMSPARHLPETTGAGCAFLDFDNDGWMDIYLVNGGRSDFFEPPAPLKNALYRNNRDGTFTDVTERAGVGGGLFGMGVAAGDYDSDGWQDLFVSNYGPGLLYRNRQDGTFEEVAEKAGLRAASGWSTSAVWFDYDNDGKLDLFVSNYVYYDKTLNTLCRDEKGRPRYCIPKLFKPAPSHLFRNQGDGTFADVSAESGIGEWPGKAFGVVATDVNNDRKMDLFVANDMTPNHLFINNGDGKFEEVGLWATVAYSQSGAVRSGMGVDAADFDGDGWQDLFVANVDHQRFSLYRNLKDLTFKEEMGEIYRDTFLLSGWGLRFFDYDNDGDMDLLLANGHPDDMVHEMIPKVSYKEPLLLFANQGGVYQNVSRTSGPVFSQEFAARGLATGDFDNDGDLDVLISNNGGPPLLLRNAGGNKTFWLGVALAGKTSNPAGTGAILNWTAGGKKRRRLKTAGGSYLSSHDPREVLGLSSSSTVEELAIEWPSGVVDRIENIAANQYITVREGEGLLPGPSDAGPKTR